VRARRRWGAFILAVEVLGATSTVLYGLNIILTPVHEPLVDDPANPRVALGHSKRALGDVDASIMRCVRRRLGRASWPSTVGVG